MPAHLTGYGAFRLFMALRTHFTTEKFDFLKYGTNTRGATEANYNKRSDKTRFEMLARRLDETTLRDLLVANLVQDRTYVIEMDGEQGRVALQALQRYRDGMSYYLADDLKRLSEAHPKPLACVSGSYPAVLSEVLAGNVTIQTFIILNNALGLVPVYDAALGNEDVIWSKVRRKALKFKPFFQYDANRAAKVLSDQNFL